MSTEKNQSQLVEGISGRVKRRNPASSAVPPRRRWPLRGELVAGIGTVLSAVLASSCCWLPLLLLAVGVSGAGIASTLSAYRPLFLGITFVCLSAAFYFTYRPRREPASGTLAVETDCCGRPVATAADNCCSGTASGGRLGAWLPVLNKGMLWLVTAMAVFFLFFPGFFARLAGSTPSAITADMQRSVLHVDGMTCDTCAPLAAKAIGGAPRVLAVEVNYADSRAVVGSQPDRPVAKDEILKALENIGFRGRFLEP